MLRKLIASLLVLSCSSAFAVVATPQCKEARQCNNYCTHKAYQVNQANIAACNADTPNKLCNEGVTYKLTSACEGGYCSCLGQ